MLPRHKFDPYRSTSTAFATELAKKTCNRPDVRYCFVLGAGASVQSGIPGARTLAHSFIREIYARQDSTVQPLERWAVENLDLDGFTWETADQHYNAIYELRFGHNPEEGFTRIDHETEKAEPSLGYFVLADILAETQHNVVVTTNFDNLVADAMAMLNYGLPLVCSHESLAMFARLNHRRPVIAKVHRDVMFSPISSRRGTSHLSTRWIVALDSLFQNHTPIFIGYGGNDGSLMNYLNHLEPRSFNAQPYWCVYRPRSGKHDVADLVNEDVRLFMSENRGIYVPILGFDELMVEIAHAMKAELDRSDLGSESPPRFNPNRFALDKDQGLVKIAEYRAERYRKSVAEVANSLGDQSTDELRAAYKSVTSDIRDAAEAHYLKSLAERDVTERRTLLEEGQALYPGHSGIKKALEDLLISGGDEREFIRKSELAVLNQDTSRLSVLWVDDRPDSNRSLVEFLTQLGHNVFLARSTQDAEDIFTHEYVDVIVSDMALSNSEYAGVDLARIVRAIDPMIPIHIYCRPWAARNLRYDALEAGVTTVTSSPSEVLGSILSVDSTAIGSVKGMSENLSPRLVRLSPGAGSEVFRSFHTGKIVGVIVSETFTGLSAISRQVLARRLIVSDLDLSQDSVGHLSLYCPDEWTEFSKC